MLGLRHYHLSLSRPRINKSRDGSLSIPNRERSYNIRMEQAMTTEDSSVCGSESINRSACYSAISSGELRAVRRGRHTLVLATDLHAWAAKLPVYKIKSDDDKSVDDT
jgi:excisionase family DNA binding protein